VQAEHQSRGSGSAPLYRALATCGLLGLACHHPPPARAEVEAPPQWSHLACDTARPPTPPLQVGTARLTAAERDAILAEARARRAAWRARGITDYRVRVAVGCFCPWPSDPRVLEVRGGQAVALLDTTGRPAGPLVEPWAPNTVEGMFAFIEQAARSADLLLVRYDRCLDYPTEIRGDQRVGLPDDWFWTKATGLTPRR